MTEERQRKERERRAATRALHIAVYGSTRLLRGPERRSKNRYSERIVGGPDIQGWDRDSLAEFDRRWLRGDTQRAMCEAFRISAGWLQIIRVRRGLPARDWPYRGGRPAAARASRP